MKPIRKIELKDVRVLTDAELKNILGGSDPTGFTTCTREEFIQDTCKSGPCIKSRDKNGAIVTGYCSKKTDIHTEYDSGNLYILICECS